MQEMQDGAYQPHRADAVPLPDGEKVWPEHRQRCMATVTVLIMVMMVMTVEIILPAHETMERQWMDEAMDAQVLPISVWCQVDGGVLPEGARKKAKGDMRWGSASKGRSKDDTHAPASPLGQLGLPLPLPLSVSRESRQHSAPGGSGAVAAARGPPADRGALHVRPEVQGMLFVSGMTGIKRQRLGKLRWVFSCEGVIQRSRN